jgi:hypothetical protein
VNTKDIHNIANKEGILWDDDPIFKMICRQLTGKGHLDEMSSSELNVIYSEITNNPAAFTKMYDNSLDNIFNNNSSNNAFIRKNYDYDSGDFLDRIRSRKKGLPEGK